MHKSVEKQLKEYLEANHAWFSAGDLQRLNWFNEKGTLAIPKSVSRRLQELAEAGEIQVELRNGHAFYAGKQEPKPKPKIPVVILPDGTRVLANEL